MALRKRLCLRCAAWLRIFGNRPRRRLDNEPHRASIRGLLRHTRAATGVVTTNWTSQGPSTNTSTVGLMRLQLSPCWGTPDAEGLARRGVVATRQSGDAAVKKICRHHPREVQIGDTNQLDEHRSSSMRCVSGRQCERTVLPPASGASAHRPCTSRQRVWPPVPRRLD